MASVSVDQLAEGRHARAGFLVALHGREAPAQFAIAVEGCVAESPQHIRTTQRVDEVLHPLGRPAVINLNNKPCRKLDKDLGVVTLRDYWADDDDLEPA